MARGAGKFGKARRGGGRHFTRNLGAPEAEEGGNGWRDKPDSESDEESSSEDGSSSSEESSDEAPTGSGAVHFASTTTTASYSASDSPSKSIAQTRSERKAAKKKAPGAAGRTGAPGELPPTLDEEEEEEDGAPGNPNRAGAKNLKAADLVKAPRELSRREREAAEKKAREERYWKLHVAGKTDQAKADLARLAQIRKEREEAAAQRKAEAEAKAAETKARAQALARGKKR